MVISTAPAKLPSISPWSSSAATETGPMGASVSAECGCTTKTRCVAARLCSMPAESPGAPRSAGAPLPSLHAAAVTARKIAGTRKRPLTRKYCQGAQQCDGEIAEQRGERQAAGEGGCTRPVMASV